MLHEAVCEVLQHESAQRCVTERPVSAVAVPGGSGCVQAPLTGGDPEDKEREEAEAEREEAEGDGEPEAPGQRARGAAEPRVRSGSLAEARRP